MAIAILGIHSVSAQSLWTTVDDFEFGFGGSSGDVGTDPSGSILYSVGSAGIDPAGNGRAAAVVRTSADRGATWTVLDTYAPEGWSDPHLRGVATLQNPDATTRVFAAGHLYNSSSGNQMWMIRESLQGDQNWALADVVQAPNGWSSCGDVKVSPGGDVYAAGLIRDTVQNTGYWLVRKRSAGAIDFQTVDTFNGGTVEARGIAFHPTAGVLVAGGVGNVWTVRRSGDGVSWSTVDSFKDTGGSLSFAESIAVDPMSGAIYVAGRAQQTIPAAKGKKPGPLVWNWVVRRSINGGATWTVIDRYGALPGGGITATAVTAAPHGIFVGGYTPDSWVVRKGVLGATGAFTWTTSDQYQMAPGQIARVNGISTDSDGNIYATGRATDGTTTSGELTFRWVTRKLLR